jgi:Ca2+:H+ antiporter
VYGLYLLFQLKSHAYMYQSTPQHIIDEESVPGPVAAWMDSSTSDDDSSSSSDSDSSGRSNTTAGRMRKLIGRRRRRRSSASRGSDPPAATRTPSYATSCASHTLDSNGAGEGSSLASHVAVRFGVTPDVHDDTDDEATHHGRSRAHSFSEKHGFRRKKDRKHRKKHHHHKHKGSDAITTTNENVPATGKMGQSLATSYNEPRRVDFAISDNTAAASDTATQKRQFSALKAISSIRPSIPQSLSQNVFTAPSPTASPAPPEEPIVTGPIPKVRYGIRRTNSLPGRLNQMNSNPGGQAPMASVVPPIANPAQVVNAVEGENIMSRTSAVLLLLISTGLVAICANFMVDSIDSVTSSTSLGPTFVGLILLPVVGNAAEHVTAVTVAAKNKMDLAIGVAVGSSIQVALFITPFIVLLAWCMGKPMTLYFTLFETVSLFVSVFVVNFLVLDGRSNYLEGSLLCCAYIIIAVAAFFYPGVDDQNQLGGAVAEPIVNMIRSVIAV